MNNSSAPRASMFDTPLAAIGLFLWALFAVGGPLVQVIPHVTEGPVVVISILVATVLFIAPVAATFFAPAGSDKWGVRQRVMLWQAASAGAFLAIDWADFADLPRFGEVAMFWVIGGAMGVLLEPARSLNGPKAPREH